METNAAVGVTKYRDSQLLFNLYSCVMATPMATLLMGTAMIAEVTILYALITSGTVIPPTVAALFAVIALDFFLIIQIVFKMLRRPYVASMVFKQKVDTLEKRGRWFNRFMKSCSPVKVPMGDGNFFDRKSSIVIWNVCINQLVALLLL